MSRLSFGERYASEQEQRGYGPGAGGYGQPIGRPQYQQLQFGQGPPAQGQYGQGQYGGQGQFEQRGWPQGQQGYGPDPRFAQESQMGYGQQGNWAQQGNWGQQEQRAAQQGQQGYSQIPSAQAGSPQGYGPGVEQGNFPQPQGNGGRGHFGSWGRGQGELGRAAEFAQASYARDYGAYGPGFAPARPAFAPEYAGQFARPGWGPAQLEWREAQRNWLQAQQPGWGQNWGPSGGPGQSARGPFAGRGPKGYKRSDERISEDVCDRLTQHGDIDAGDIEVRVSNGEVTLAGSVDCRWTKRLAEDLIEDVSGIREVHNQLRVQQAPFGQQAPHQAAGERGRQGEREPARQAQAAGRS